MVNYVIEMYLADNGPHTVGQTQLIPAIDQHGFSNASVSSFAVRDTRVPEPCRSPPSLPSSASRSTIPSIADTASSTNSNATTISNTTSLSTAPSSNQNDYFDQVIVNTPINALDLPCIFQDIMDCPDVVFGDFDAWSEHIIIDHFGPRGPPPHALCIFCDRSYEDEDPMECWNKYLEHISDHFQGGRTLNHRRPDFRVLKYLRDERMMTAQDYQHFCTGTERPTMADGNPVPGLLPLDSEPEELVLKRQAKEDLSNRVIVSDRRHGRERQRLTRRNKTLPTAIFHS